MYRNVNLPNSCHAPRNTVTVYITVRLKVEEYLYNISNTGEEINQQMIRFVR